MGFKENKAKCYYPQCILQVEYSARHGNGYDMTRGFT